jgi:aminopeptidase N
MLNGKLPGLVVDADLRWHFLNSLVERGQATKEEVETELAGDQTANGLRYAAFAHAAFPNAATKAEAFRSALEDGLSNHIQLSTIRGFQRPIQRELLTEYADKYFDVVLDVWAKENYEIASNVAAMLYPSLVISQDTLTATEKWLSGAGKDAPNGLRRIMAENRDALARALNAQAKDASSK